MIEPEAKAAPLSQQQVFVVGAIGLALIVYLSRHGTLNDGAVAATYIKIAAAKTSLPFVQAFFAGVLCNLLVCLALWLALAGRSVTDKILAVIFPVSAFVAAGFEHRSGFVVQLRRSARCVASEYRAMDGNRVRVPRI